MPKANTLQAPSFGIAPRGTYKDETKPSVRLENDYGADAVLQGTACRIPGALGRSEKDTRALRIRTV
jgi:hypothetical protein